MTATVTSARAMLRAANLALLVLFPLSWFAPLMRAGLLPFFGQSEISVISGIGALWDSDPLLALIVMLFAMVAPLGKTLGLALIQFSVLPARAVGPVRWAGRLAMADIFLVAIYIVLVKGIGIGRVETAWGLYLFTGCVLASLAISYLENRSDAL